MHLKALLYDTRQYLIEKSTHKNFEFFKKSPAQKMEVEIIADLARLLFRMLVECDFIPTKYLIVLAIVMCQEPKLEYPQSKSELFNNQYIDLLLEEGAIILTDKNKDIEQEINVEEKSIHNKQNSDKEIQAIQSKWIQLIPEDKCKRFIDHCDSIIFDWK